MSFVSLGVDPPTCGEGDVYDPNTNACVPVGVIVQTPPVQPPKPAPESKLPPAVVFVVGSIAAIAIATILWEGDK